MSIFRDPNDLSTLFIENCKCFRVKYLEGTFLFSSFFLKSLQIFVDFRIQMDVMNDELAINDHPGFQFWWNLIQFVCFLVVLFNLKHLFESYFVKLNQRFVVEFYIDSRCTFVVDGLPKIDEDSDNTFDFAAQLDQ